MPAGRVPPATMSRGPASVPQDGGAHTVNRVSRDNSSWTVGREPVLHSHLRGSLCPVPRKLTSFLHFSQPVNMVGLARPVLSVAAAHPVPPATMSLGSATVHPASLGLAVSRVGAPPTPALWRGTTGFPRVRPGLTLVDLYLACQPGTFGKNCEHLCRCPGETWACHPASGTCICAAGYHGTDCQQRESGDRGFCLPF